jgi:hypothetical protein
VRLVKIEFDGLDDLIASVEEIASGQLMEDLSMNVAEVAAFKSKECFSEDEDPYGKGWDDWAHPPTRPHVKLMVETGALVESIEAIDVTRDGFTIGSFGAVSITGKDHAHLHQEGTTIMPARKFLPDNGIPDEWLDEFEQEFADAIEEILNA